jgi:tripartite-type tricarboxylate transporter receptor subunit TctC
MSRALAALGLALLALAGAVAQAQDYPSRPIKLVVAYPAGGANDLIARVVGKRLAELLGQPVVIDNRAGAGGTMGANSVARSAPDGYTLFMAAGAHTLAPSLHAQLPYDIITDFAAIGLVGRGSYVLSVNPGVPVRSVEELVAYAKRPGVDLRFASSGVGAPPHLAGEVFKSMSGASLRHIAYKAELAALNDMMAGHVEMGFLTLSNTAPLAKAGRLRALAVTGARRSSALPELPTLAELGYPGYDVSTWWGVLAPAGTPAPLVAKLHGALSKIVSEPEYKAQLAVQGMEVDGGSPEEFAAFLKSEKERYAGIVRTAGIKPE